jgi:hypothetical protein
MFVFIAALIALNGDVTTQEFSYNTLQECKTDQVLFMLTAMNNGIEYDVVECFKKDG